MSNAVFHLGLLRNYQLVGKPGVYVVSVAHTITEDHLILDDHPRYLVPLRAITSKGLTGLLSVINKESDTVSFSSVRHYFLMGSIWFDDAIKGDLPVKGEKVLATFDIKDDKLLCTNIERLPREELDYVDINNLIDFRKTLLNLMNKKD